jgi:hypothetical protein
MISPFYFIAESEFVDLDRFNNYLEIVAFGPLK